ncbi:serine hydrolase [Aquimarina sp. I32.4]|uniref:serine hydrolase domain-containing protein n=1 Tax=Aquimarina sp. I32.4 TaxID=2053903 RepID=UPI0011AF995F|nr:serine hydrolase domain-containing protein [Aquimarina sp. I32.4]
MIKSQITPILFIILLLATVCSHSCQPQTEKELLNTSIKENARKLLEDYRLNAVSIAVYANGVGYTEHFGELDKGKANSPTNETLYEVASVTKTMTGYLVAKAVTEAKLKLTDPITKYMGNAYQHLSYNKKPITIQDLLTHTSGLPLNIEGVDELYINPSRSSYTKAQELLTYYPKDSLLNTLKKIKLEYLPGTQYSYSNVAPNVLAHILEVVYKKPFDDVLQEYLFEPAMMDNTKINLTNEEQELLANGHNAKGEVMPNFKKPIKLWGAAGRAKSNATDMLNYIKFQLNDQNPVVKESHTKLFRDLENLWIGYFWEILEDKDGMHIEHHGGIYGTQNWLIIYPEHDFGISVIANSSFPEANRLLKQTALHIFKDFKNNY